MHRLGPEGLPDTLRVPRASERRRFFSQRFLNLSKRQPRRRIGVYEVTMAIYEAISKYHTQLADMSFDEILTFPGVVFLEMQGYPYCD